MTSSPIHVDRADARALPLPDASVDLIVTSPPYSLDMPYELGDVPPAEWPTFTRAWLGEAYRVTRDAGRLAVNVPLDTTKGGKRPLFCELVLAALSAGWLYRCTLVWNEGNVRRSIARGSVNSASAPHIITPVEMIPLFYKGTWERESNTPSDLDHDEWLEWTNGLWTFPGLPRARAWGKYPAAFPEELPHRLIKLLSFPGDVVLDPFSGSGTTAAVARCLGRIPWAFDNSPRAVRITTARLAQARYQQASLFLDAQRRPGAPTA